MKILKKSNKDSIFKQHHIIKINTSFFFNKGLLSNNNLKEVK